MQSRQGSREQIDPWAGACSWGRYQQQAANRRQLAQSGKAEHWGSSAGSSLERHVYSSTVWLSRSRGQMTGVLVYRNKTPTGKLMKRVGSRRTSYKSQLLKWDGAQDRSLSPKDKSPGLKSES